MINRDPIIKVFTGVAFGIYIYISDLPNWFHKDPRY